MSKLADRIRRATRREGAPMGFGAAASRKPAPSMLLLARCPAESGKAPQEALSHGADIIVLEGDVSRLKDRTRELAQACVGVQVGGLDAKTVANLKEASPDFVVFEPETAAAEALLEEGLGFVLALGQEASDAELRVMESLPLDAIVVPPLQRPFTVQSQLALKRLSLLARTPMLMEVGMDASAAELRCLREAGVVGVITEGGDGRRLAQLRQVIDALPPPREGRRKERAEAILPAVATAHAIEEEEEDE